MPTTRRVHSHKRVSLDIGHNRTNIFAVQQPVTPPSHEMIYGMINASVSGSAASTPTDSPCMNSNTRGTDCDRYSLSNIPISLPTVSSTLKTPVSGSMSLRNLLKSMSSSCNTTGGRRSNLNSNIYTSNIFPFNAVRTKKKGSDTAECNVLPSIASMRSLGVEDEFSLREKEIIHEINKLRSDPVAYAAMMSHNMELHSPFIDCCRMTLSQLKRFVAGKREEEKKLTVQLEELDVKEKEENKTLTAQWAIEDIDREKKNKKNPIMRKRGTEYQQQEAIIQQERSALLEALAADYAKERTELRSQYTKVSDELLRSSHGVNLLEQCCRKVAAAGERHDMSSSAVKGLPLLTYSRGLSLASREACECDGKATADEAGAYASHYGKGASYGAAAFVGSQSVSQTVMEVLLGLQDPMKIGRASLLDPNFNFGGCGWRESTSSSDGTKACKTYIILSSRFEELKAVSDRDHLPLSQVKHVLPCAMRQYPGSVITLDKTNFSVSLLEPKCQPIVCGNTTRLLFKCGEGVRLCGVVYTLTDPEPKEASVGQGQTLVQHLGDNVVEMNVVLHCRGEFGLIIFAAGSGETNAGYRMIGKVRISSESSLFDPSNRIYCYPITSDDFQRRRVRILSPVTGAFTPSSMQTFHITIPISKYLSEMSNTLEQDLTMTSAQLECSGKSIVDLKSLADETMNDVRRVEEDTQVRLSALTMGISQIQKEAAKKRGKELDKLRNVLSQHEMQHKRLEESVKETYNRAADTQMKLESFHRTVRQMDMHHFMLLRDKEQLDAVTDRSVPLRVVLRMDVREVAVPVVPESNNIEYKVSLRVPDKIGKVCMYVSDILVVSWDVNPDA